MLHAVIFTDDPARGTMRARHMDAHLAFLDAHRDRIAAAGPLLDGAGAPHGGLWLVEAPDAAAVRALVEADPLWPTGLRRAVAIHPWRRVFADGRRL
jgi:uncharacterized protein YciI